MNIGHVHFDHIHFYVEDAYYWRDWFVHKLGFQVLADQSTFHTDTIALKQAAIQFRVSSPRSSSSPVAAYLAHHPPGVGDLAFRVLDLERLLQQAEHLGVQVLQPVQLIQTAESWQKTAQIQGWGDLQHTLIETSNPLELPSLEAAPNAVPSLANSDLISIDHVVLNVEQGDLEHALAWYEDLFGLQRHQNFAIQTEYSALCSQVLRHPKGSVQFPINEPASQSSQIQEFLDWNRGSGIQHIALRTGKIVPLMTRLRQQGLAFLPIPATYYEQLAQRPGLPLSKLEQELIAQQEVLADWPPDNPQALLLQVFTQPIFEQPTFFFELIERRSYWLNQLPLSQVTQAPQVAEGFGEGNFRALFEAIEREQIKRGSLQA
jgi:4-hydroxyphenylpyruvate dioxygenase